MKTLEYLYSVVDYEYIWPRSTMKEDRLSGLAMLIKPYI